MTMQHDTAKVSNYENGESTSVPRIGSRFPQQFGVSGVTGRKGPSRICFALQIVCLLTLVMGPEAMAQLNDHHYQNRHGSISLTVFVQGEGTVSSNPDGISCSNGRCEGAFPLGTVVRLQAKPDEGQILHGWRGACWGSKNCAVELNGPRKVMATFRAPRFLPLRVLVKGEGTVTSSLEGLECSKGVCFGKFPENSVVTLSAIPGEEHTFNGWQGSCRGEETCTVKLKRPRTVVVNFRRPL